ncbi:MAG: hypothetical protein M0042_14865 [Nitrospiraceae bacterium]|nr:hypothetical protein [Nitrospiraceae bacterium]
MNEYTRNNRHIVILLLAAVFCALASTGWIAPQQAQAAVSELDPWPAAPQIANVAASPATTSFTPSAGSNRIVLISVHDHTNNTTATTITVSYGTNNIPARAIVNSPNNQRRQSWFFYLNESDIAAASGTTVTVTNNNVGSGMSVYIATLAGVDQTTPINGTYQIYNSNTASVTLGTLNVNAGGYGIFGSTQSLAGAPTNNESYTGNTPQTVGTAYSCVAVKSFPSAGATGPALTWTGNTYAGLAFTTINPASGASGNLTVGDGASVANANAQQGSTNNAIDSFTTAMSSGAGQINTLTLTTSAQFTAANVTNIGVYLDAGTLGVYDAGVDTLVPSSFSIGAGTATVTFTSPENVSTATANYLITANIASGATVGNTLGARVTGASGTLGTPTYSDTASATLTISAPVCTRANPAITLSPASQTLAPGGSITYVVQVTNNDSASCADTTFALSSADVPAAPNANFNASTLAATIGPITGGSFQTTNLTVSATAGAANGSSTTTSVTTAADANHGAVTSSTVSSTVGTGAPPAGVTQSPAGNAYVYAVLAAGMVLFVTQRSRKKRAETR